MVAHDLRVSGWLCPGHYVVHGVGKAQRQLVGLALAQHLGQVALGVYVQQENFLSFQRKTGPQVVDSRAFANSALLICYAYHSHGDHTGAMKLLEGVYALVEIAPSEDFTDCQKYPALAQMFMEEFLAESEDFIFDAGMEDVLALLKVKFKQPCLFE